MRRSSHASGSRLSSCLGSSNRRRGVGFDLHKTAARRAPTPHRAMGDLSCGHRPRKRLYLKLQLCARSPRQQPWRGLRQFGKIRPLARVIFVNDLRLPKPKIRTVQRTRAQAACRLADQGAHPMKLLLLFLIVGAVLLMSYFGEPVRREQADRTASPS